MPSLFQITSLAVLISVATSPLTAATPANAKVLGERAESAADHDARMAWFRDARFGMFIHWGLYSQYGGVWKGKVAKVNNCAEWLMLAAKAPRLEYAAAAKDFNPKDYDAEAWAAAAAGAGMKYVVITAKHHEGFAMFKSDASPYNIVDASPFKRDPIKELAAACRKHGLKFGVYYSQNLDWYHPGGGSGQWDPSHKGDADKYVDGIVIPQLKELLKNYGEISVLWFDIPGGVINKPRADRIMKAILSINPKIIVNNRLGGGYHGDIETPEQFIPPMGFPGKDWEACMTMNRTWGFAKDDHQWKSADTLVRNLADSASKGGNYLLNIGPDELGRIPAPSLERLAAIGDWMKINGEAIQGTSAGVFPSLPEWGRITVRTPAGGAGPATLYAIVYDCPKDGALRFPGLISTVTGSRILGSDDKVSVSAGGNTVVATIPETLRTRKNIVVALTLDGPPRVDDTTYADTRGVFVLSPRQALTDRGIKLEISGAEGIYAGPEDHLGNWTDKNASVRWTLTVAKAGKYTLAARVGAKPEADGSELTVSVGKESVTIPVKKTGDWNKYVSAPASAPLVLPAGRVELVVRTRTVKGPAPCNLGAITLTPAD